MTILYHYAGKLYTDNVTFYAECDRPLGADTREDRMTRMNDALREWFGPQARLILASGQ